MASFTKRGPSWRALIKLNGVRDSGTFDTKTEAQNWAKKREFEILGGKVKPTKHSLATAMEVYGEEESPKRRGCRWEQVRLKMLARTMDCADIPLKNLRASHLAEWRNARLQKVSTGTVRREMVLIRSVLETARKEWGWINENPIQDVKKPAPPPHRERLVSIEERDAIVARLGYTTGTIPTIGKHRVAMAFLFALETGMRTGEIYKLTWDRVFLEERFVRLKNEIVEEDGRDQIQFATKNGDSRDVPLSKAAVELLRLLPRTKGAPCFDMTSSVSDVLFRKAKDAAGVVNLHFHDSRATALTRLAKKLHVLDLARMVGHRNPASLMIYYRESASSIASRLD